MYRDLIKGKQLYSVENSIEIIRLEFKVLREIYFFEEWRCKNMPMVLRTPMRCDSV
jgi:hypothetical protein